MGNITPDNYPAGTRVIHRQTGRHGVVSGWTRSGSIGIRWDNGGTSVAPAHHASIAPEPVEEPLWGSDTLQLPALDAAVQAAAQKIETDR